MEYFFTNFQMAITQPNLGQFVKSQTFLNFSFPALQDSGIGLWIWLGLRGVMKGFSRVIIYRRRTCIISNQLVSDDDNGCELWMWRCLEITILLLVIKKYKLSTLTLLLSCTLVLYSWNNRPGSYKKSRNWIGPVGKQ